MSVEGGMHRTPDHTPALTMDDAHLAKPEAHAFVEVLGDERRDVARQEGVEIELVGNFDVHHVERIGCAIVLLVAVVFLVGLARHQPNVGERRPPRYTGPAQQPEPVRVPAPNV
jgi:hypothetical protein